MTFIQPYWHDRYHCSKMLSYAVIIFKYKQNSKKYGITLANMSTAINKGIKMRCKSVTANFFTVVGLLVENITAIAKPKGYLEAFLSIGQPLITVTYSSPVITPSLPSSFFFSSMLRSNSKIHRSIGLQWSNVESYVVNITDLCVTRVRTEKINCAAIIKYLSIVDLIK